MYMISPRLATSTLRCTRTSSDGSDRPAAGLRNAEPQGAWREATACPNETQRFTLRARLRAMICFITSIDPAARRAWRASMKALAIGYSRT